VGHWSGIEGVHSASDADQAFALASSLVTRWWMSSGLPGGWTTSSAPSRTPACSASRNTPARTGTAWFWRVPGTATWSWTSSHTTADTSWSARTATSAAW